MSTRSPLLVERAHTIRVTMHPSHADLVVKRTVWNGGARNDQAIFYIDLPSRAVATGLRTLATLAGRPHWFDGELMEAEAAAAKYRELTGIGGYYPKDPALLSWRSADLLALQVFPCPPKAEKSVEYTLKIPTNYRKGAHHVSLPKLGTDEVTAAVTVEISDRRNSLRIGELDESELDESGRAAMDVSVTTPNPAAIEGELVTIPVSDHRVLTHYAVRAAPMLATVPRGAYVAVVVDGSRSTAEDFGAAARSSMLAYLSHFEDARVEVFVFDRKVRRRYDRFLPVRVVRRDLVGWQPTRENGSDVDRGIAASEVALEKAPPNAPKRIVLVTDGHVRRALTAERLRGALASGSAIAHIGILSTGDAELSRDDSHAWADAVRPTGGLVWRAAAGTSNDAETRKVFEEWARPVRLDHVQVFSSELPLSTRMAVHDDETPVETIDEGEGTEQLFIAERAASWIRVEGELWARRVDRTFSEDSSARKLWAAAVFGTPVLSELSEQEMMPLAMLGGAVSPVTSYLAIEPGVRPSFDGLEGGGIGLWGFGSGGGDRGATGVTGAARPLDRMAFLRDAMKSAWRRCGGAPDTGSVTLETTFAEIVNIETTGPDTILRTCLSETAWQLVLPPQFSDDWMTWSLDV